MGSKSAIGIGNGICFKQVRDKGGGSYIDPLVRDSIVGIWKSDQNTNESPTRNIIKNTIKDKGGDLELLNFGYKLNSGYGKYEEDFTDWIIYPNIKVTDSVITTDGNFKSSWFIYKHSSESKINEMNIKVSGIPKGGKILYFYISDETANLPIAYTIPKDGIYHLPESKINKNRASVGFTVESRYDWNNIRIEQIPSFEGALVTDGKDDLITSTKTVSEMGITDEVTVVSLVHQVSLNSTYNRAFTNYLEILDGSAYIRNDVVNGDKTGIYGYTSKLNTNVATVINNILGDKSDYGSYSTNIYNSLSNTKFSVVGRISEFREISSVAWYWTFIANKVLTTDQINQVISYFNLDKHVKPDIIYDTIRQGITNENHASFNDELTDFSGNGHNMKIYNSAWNKESGINDEGAWQTDGVTDYGQYIGDLGLQDYTIAVDRAYVEAKPSQVSIMSNAVDGSTNTPFLMEHMGINKILAPHSFGKYTVLSELNINRFISYQSTYKYNRNNLDRGTSTNTGSGLTIGRIGGVASQYANIALWSLLLFPYSLSEFLLERQLKRYKLGTLYPNMVEWRPIISSNIPYDKIEFFDEQWTKRIYPGDYVEIGATIKANLYLNNYDISTITSLTSSQFESVYIDRKGQYYDVVLSGIKKSPQKINITIDEYIRYEDIVQPYPAIINLKQDGKTITWGDKLKVGSDIVFVESANLLPELYTVSETRYNGVTLYPNTIIKVEKSMVFDNARTYLKANEPNCILSPNRLRIPNSSYKILGYIPDLTGKGNHGRLNNFAYTEESGANEDGSIRFDGTDDHITISNIIGGKCIMAKVTVNRNSGIIYDQRRANVPNKSWMQLNPSSVIFEQNAVSTYIDGILNHNVTGSDLVSKTVNLTCELEIGDTSGTYQPTIGSSYAVGYTIDINLYEFMLFPDVPDEEEIKELNNVIGIEGGYVESPNYYWDAYDKKNTDTDRNLIADQVSKDVANALEVKNVAYNSESGYTDDNGLLLDGVEDHAINTVIPAVTDFTVIGKRNILNYECFVVKGGNTTSTAAFVLEYGSDKFYNFGGVNTVEYPNTITVDTKSSYNNNPAVSSQGIDSLGLRIGEYRNYYSKLVFYKLMLYTKTIDQLSINMLKNLFERDELIDITNPIFKKKEL